MLGKTLIYCLFSLVAAAQTINTFAGNGGAGFAGDGGPATQAQINRVVGLAADASGNLYLADENNHRVRKVDSNGVITTIAGTGTPGFAGDGGPAAQAQLNHPTGVCVSSQGDIYVNDQANFRVRKISGGTITTVAGNGSNASSGDGGPANQAAMVIPIRCAVDRSGNLFIADQGGMRVRKVDTKGNISTFAGNGAQSFAGDGGPAASASLNNPTALAFDSTDNLFITDQFNQRIRKVDGNGTITTVAGNGGAAGYSGDGGPATQASFNFPGSLAVDSAGTLFIVDEVNNRIRKVVNGVVTTIAGTGAAGFSGDGGPATQAVLNRAFALALDINGNLYTGDTTNNRVRVITNAAALTPPNLDFGSTANGATYVSGGLVPGSWAQVKGVTISPITRIWGDADFAGLGNNLPTTLSGVSVKVNGTPAAVYFISSTQVSFQVPAGVSGGVTVQVSRNGVAGNTVNSTAVSSAPGIFPLLVGSKNYPAGVFADGKFTGDPALGGGAFRKARPGDVVQLFATGLQASPAGTTVSNNTVGGVTVTVGGVVIPADFAGLVGVGLFQINFTVPQLAAGEYPITITVNGQSSPPTINSSPPAPLVIPIG